MREASLNTRGRTHLKAEPTIKVPEGSQKAIVVGVFLSDEEEIIQRDSLDELNALLATLGVEVAGRIIQRRQKLTAKCLLGTGKVDEIRLAAEAAGADLIVVDRPLSPPQVRNLEQMTCRQIMDRAGVILEIFAKHARSNQAKTQVEIARLEYLLPRLTGAWTHFQRQTGGGHKARGMGEKQIEIDRRRARERIIRLQKQLAIIDNEKKLQRKARENELKVALVGYTNSGKTTLMNGLTTAKVQGQDVLFATLDASVRTLDPSTRPKILLSDTVGFIRNLPHGLIESFKTTLAEVAEADLLLQVVDVSHPHYELHLATTEAVLREIGAADVPVLLVFNKCDALEDPMLPRILRQAYPAAICLSARSEADILMLRKEVYRFFEKRFIRTRLRIPHADRGAISSIRNSSIVVSEEYLDDTFIEFDLRLPASRLFALRHYMVDASEVLDGGEKH